MLDVEMCGSYSYQCYFSGYRGVAQTIRTHYDCVVDKQLNIFRVTEMP